jgi:hypothetical protein
MRGQYPEGTSSGELIDVITSATRSMTVTKPERTGRHRFVRGFCALYHQPRHVMCSSGRWSCDDAPWSSDQEKLTVKYKPQWFAT